MTDRVLIVDDEAGIRQALKQVLDYEGMENEPLLGWSTLVKNVPIGRDPADAVLNWSRCSITVV